MGPWDSAVIFLGGGGLPKIEADREEKELDTKGTMHFPSMTIPSFRMLRACQKGLEKNILIRTQGGLGDVICAEPAIRWGVEKFEGIEVTIETHFPELFAHLPVKAVVDAKGSELDAYQYHTFDSLYQADVINSEFVVALYTHVVDYAALCLWRSQLPVRNRNIVLRPGVAAEEVAVLTINPETDVLIHAGRTWQSRTVPPHFWNKVIAHIAASGKRPVLIGRESYGLTGNIKLDTTSALDLRDNFSLAETIAQLQRCRVLLTNDSSPIHMAASGEAWVGTISTVKHPDFIHHWRHGEFAWRMKDFAKGGLYERIYFKPHENKNVTVDTCDPEDLLTWLPDPIEFAEWGMSKVDGA